MIIRKANLGDSEAIAKVQVATWKTTYQGIIPDNYLNSMVWEARVSLWENIIFTQTAYVVENQDKQVVGFCNIGKGNVAGYPNYEGELYAFYILKNYQRLGIGRQLFNQVVEDFKDKGIHSFIIKVLRENPSKHFYESLGAKKISAIEEVFSEKKVIELVYGYTTYAAVS